MESASICQLGLKVSVVENETKVFEKTNLTV